MPPKDPKKDKGSPKGKPKTAKGKRSKPEAVSSESDLSPLEAQGLHPTVLSQLKRAIREDAIDPSDRLQMALGNQVVYFLKEQGLSPLQALLAIQNVLADLLNHLAEHGGPPKGAEDDRD